MGLLSDRRKRKPEEVVPLLLLDEFYSTYSHSKAEVDFDEQQTIILSMIQAAQSVGLTRFATVSAAVKVLDRINEQTKNHEEMKEPKRTSRGFQEFFIDYFKELTNEKLCLYLAENDLSKAEWYYCECDYSDVYTAAAMKFDLEVERNRVLMEAALFGFGGKYEGNDKSRFTDLSDDDWEENAKGLAAALTVM